MEVRGFNDIAARYERDSLIQKSAAEKLIGLLNIGRDDDILDLGCGTGALARKLRSITDGRVEAVDAAVGMIHEAKTADAGSGVAFHRASAEDLAYADDFSVIFCNSAFQWFRDPAAALRNCHRALRPGGRMGIQAPAKNDYCPNFLAALDAVARDPRTRDACAGFRPPWLFLESGDEYAALFEKAGFTVPFATIESVTTRHAPEEVMTIFESGAAAGYLNRDYYRGTVDDSYGEAFREVVRDAFRRQTDNDGKVGLLFNRIYLVAAKG